MPIFKKLNQKKEKEQEEQVSVPSTEEEIGEEETEEENSWINEEGQLAIDVYETPKKIVIKSTLAGVDPKDLDISLNNDMLTIRGKRDKDENIPEESYLYQECYWGNFSRSIILPVEVDSKNIDAALENGILTITLKKAKHEQNISIKVK